MIIRNMKVSVARGITDDSEKTWGYLWQERIQMTMQIHGDVFGILMNRASRDV